ncbi:hypothetical protein RD110_15585 [Rhodoferax koreense]|uniref:Uncharacterized protein n=1 Tax=Rhodoferax koreensis TaxID=1842727 RepID=A0A1P8JXF6_9BURK|nr:hypothetical protein [Rhodoferax koreense]APW38444.1 hypothetical protein RD110_15585 [Rhodoferax koreense]
MTRIRYVGAKDAERAFIDKTGIVWTPGDEHEIEVGTASRMLQHPDVFADAEKFAAAQKFQAETQVAVVLGAGAGAGLAQAIANIPGVRVTLMDEDVLNGFDLSNLSPSEWNALDEEARLQWMADADRLIDTPPGPDAPQFTILVDGKVTALDDLDKTALHALANQLGVKVHHNAGAENVRNALLAAHAPPADGEKAADTTETAGAA